MTLPRIYLSPPHMSGLEQQYVQETFASNWSTSAVPWPRRSSVMACACPPARR